MANQGITHLAFKTGGRPLCNTRRAIMSISIDRYRAGEQFGVRECSKCLAKLAAMDEKLQKKKEAV